jgi:hypothetical protein
VLPQRGLSPQYYEVVQEPVSATAETEDVAHQILIVVRRAKAPVKLRSDNDAPDTVAGGSQSGGLN